jgi:hypothetical protein
MTGTQDTVSVEIRALVDKFIADLKSAGGAAGDAGREIGDGLKHAGSGAAEAHGPLGGFVDVLKDYRREVSQEGRFASILARDIASMGIASKDAAGEITQFVGAFAVGGGIGVAIEGLKFLVGKFNEVTHEEEAAQAALKKYADDGAAQIGELIKRNDDLLKSKKQLREEEATGLLVKDQIDLTNKLAKANQEYTDAFNHALENANASRVKDISASAVAEAATRKEAKAVEEITAALERKNGEIEIARKLVDEEFARIARLAQLEQQRTEHADALAAEFAYRRDVLIAENVISVDLAKKDADRAQKAFDAAEAAEQEERAYRDMVRDEENLVGYDALHADYQFRANDALKEQKQDWKDIRPVISTIASDITSMLFDAKSLDDVLKDIARQVVQTALQLALKGATMSLFGFEHGGDIPSAATGLDIPASNTGTPILVHGGEAIVTHSTTDRLKNFLNSWESGGGGAGVVNHFHGVWDGESVRRFVNSQDYARAQRDARRMGRIP